MESGTAAGRSMAGLVMARQHQRPLFRPLNRHNLACSLPRSGPGTPSLPRCLSRRRLYARKAPWARREAILAASAFARGRPRRLPFALAFLSPARIRSAIKLRSSSPTAPRTVKTSLPVGVLVSTRSERETNSIQGPEGFERQQGEGA